MIIPVNIFTQIINDFILFCNNVFIYRLLLLKIKSPDKYQNEKFKNRK